MAAKVVVTCDRCKKVQKQKVWRITSEEYDYTRMFGRESHSSEYCRDCFKIIIRAIAAVK